MASVSLARLMPPPSNPVETSGSWLHVEDALGTQLPDDFKEFIRHYGSGKINHFLLVLNPFSSRKRLNLLEQSKLQLDVLRELRDEFGETNPYKLYPAIGGLLPVAITENGDVVHWLTNGSPEKWVIVVNEARSPDYELFKCNLTEFLEALMEKTIECRAFPKMIFDEKIEFSLT